ncbi:MAG: IS256 family transposase [Gammaproteobacteria bacterium]
MREQSTERGGRSSVVWENLEEWVRGRIQGYLQDLLVEEVTVFLGREKSERRAEIDGPGGYRNGYGKVRKLALSCGTVALARPRVRGVEERFESRLLPLFVRRTQAVADLLPSLYLHGLSMGDFELALRGLLGEGAPLSGSSVARLKAKWAGEFELWNQRSLEDLEVVYLWVDGVYVKAGLEKEKAALLVVVAGLSDGRKVFLAITPGYRESTESWSAVLRDLKKRGLRAPRLVVGDGHLGIWGGLAAVYPEAEEQRCWNHRILNVLDKLPKKRQAEAKALLCPIPYAPTRQEAEKAKEAFQRWCRQQGFQAAAALLDHDWERMVAFYRYPKEHWIHLRTTNPIESPFAAVRLRTNAAKRFKKVDNATALIWKIMLVAETTFRRLNATELLKEVYHGIPFADGIRKNDDTIRKAA